MSHWFCPNPASVAPGVLAAQVTPPGVGTLLQPAVVSERLREFFFPHSEAPVSFSCTREGLLQMSLEWFHDRKIFMIVNGPMSQEWFDIADDCRSDVTIFDIAYGAEPDIQALGLELAKEKYDILMFVETDVFLGVSLNAQAICAVFREKCPDGMVVTDISGCVFCGFDEIISEISDVCLCASEMALGLPPGLGLVVPNERAHTRLLVHNAENGRYFNYPRRTVSRSVSALDAPPYSLLNALNEQIDMVLAEGMPARMQRLAPVQNYVYEWIMLRNFPIVAVPQVYALNSTAIELPVGMAPRDMVEFAERYGIFVADAVGQMPENLLTIYHGNDTRPEDVRAMTRVLDRFLNDYDTRRRNIPRSQIPQEQKV